MKSIALTFIALTFFTILLACNHKKAQETKDPVKGDTTEVTNDKPEPVKQPADQPYQAVGFNKTACFGKCPVYEVKFFTNNTATWFGKMNVERMGHFEAKLPANTIQQIKDKAMDVGYMDFYNEYPVGHKVADLPSTITEIRIDDMVKTVKNTHEGPEKLTEFEAYLQRIIDALDWKAVKND